MNANAARWVAVTGDMPDVAGAIVYWSLSGLASGDDLDEAWRAAGLDPDWLPPVVSAETALARAVQARAERHLLARRVSTGVWELVREHVTTIGERETLRHAVELHAEIGENGAPVVTDLANTPASNANTARVKHEAAVFRFVLTCGDISNWLSGMVVQRFGAVGLRDRGGMYFVPADRMEAWRAAVAVLRQVSSHVVYEIPAMRSESAVEAIIASLRVEAEDHVAKMEEYMAQEPSELSTKGLNTYARQAAAVREKLDHYARTLGAALPDMVERCAALGQRITAAKIIAKGNE